MAGFKAPGAGMMRHRVALQTKDMTPASGGLLTDNYRTIATVWAAINTIFGGRLIDGVQDQERITHTFIIRHRSDVEDVRFILAGGDRYEVRSAGDPLNTGEWLEITAEKIEVA